MTVREYAKQAGHEIVGKLTRCPDREMELQPDGNMKRGKGRAYVDEAGNEYYIDTRGVCIVDPDGSVI